VSTATINVTVAATDPIEVQLQPTDAQIEVVATGPPGPQGEPGGAGVANHNELDGRSEADAHPLAAIVEGEELALLIRTPVVGHVVSDGVSIFSVTADEYGRLSHDLLIVDPSNGTRGFIDLPPAEECPNAELPIVAGPPTEANPLCMGASVAEPRSFPAVWVATYGGFPPGPLADPFDMAATINGTVVPFTYPGGFDEGVMAEVVAAVDAMLAALEAAATLAGEPVSSVQNILGDGTVTITTDEVGDTASFAISDTGTGNPFGLGTTAAIVVEDGYVRRRGITGEHGQGEWGQAEPGWTGPFTHTWPDDFDRIMQYVIIRSTGEEWVGEWVPRAELLSYAAGVGIDFTELPGNDGTDPKNVAKALDILAGAAGHGWTVLVDETLGTAAAQIDVDITGFNLIRGYFVGHSDTTASGTTGLRLRFNGDSGNNYSSGGAAAASMALLGNVSGAQTNIDRVSEHQINIAHHTNGWTVGKSVNVAPASTGTTVPVPNSSSFGWMVTTAPTLLSLFLVAGSFATGSRLYLEGR
jgi:hypothetical protein